MTSALITEALAPIKADPSASALLFDIDGTLAPIVQHASDAAVPEATRTLLINLSRRYQLVGCVSGRRASDARAMVSIGSIPYVGSHGAEVLRPGWMEAKLDPGLEKWVSRVSDFRREFDTVDLQRRRVRVEDKGPIIAFHWRGASDEDSARAAVDAIAAQASEHGLEVHWGRKVMEVRPPVRVDKGDGVRALLGDQRFDAVLYAGDDVTDLDAFRALRGMHEDGTVPTVVLVGIRSDEGPPEIVEEADIVVEGTDGLRELVAVLTELA